MPTPHASSSSSSFFDLIIVGGGPAGMAAAIAAKRRGLRYVVLEKGGLVQSLADYPTDMVFFTTPELLEIGGLPFVSPHDKPTRQEALKYYRKVCDAFDLDVRPDGETLASGTSGARPIEPGRLIERISEHVDPGGGGSRAERAAAEWPSIGARFRHGRCRTRGTRAARSSAAVPLSSCLR